MQKSSSLNLFQSATSEMWFFKVNILKTRMADVVPNGAACPIPLRTPTDRYTHCFLFANVSQFFSGELSVNH